MVAVEMSVEQYDPSVAEQSADKQWKQLPT
jgi:hypothetical protein